VYGVAGVDLNYSEVVVYDEARVVPSYLIVYSLSAQAATPEKERVLAKTTTTHAITSKDQSELHSWSPRKEKALQAGSPTSSSSYASASTAALSPAKKKQKISCEISGVVKGAKMVVCDFCKCRYLPEGLGVEKASDLLAPYKCPKCEGELDKFKDAWETFFTIPYDQQRVLKPAAILEVRTLPANSILVYT
jgi:hypothetical protein